MTRTEVQDILNNIKYRDWDFYLGDDNGRMYLQIQFMEVDAISNVKVMALQKCRKWLISPYMTTTEIVRMAHKAVQTAVEHEVDENFMYKNERIYGPHINVEALVEASRKIEVRS